MNLTRPLCFFDLETTGVDVQADRIVSIAMIINYPDGSVAEKSGLINPGIPIPAAATAVHGITNEMVAGKPTFKQIGKSLFEIISGCDLAGFNSNSFDVPLLFNEFQRIGLNLEYSSINLIDISNIYRIQNPRTLAAAYKQYTGCEMENAHNATADIKATIELFNAMINKHDDIPQDMSGLALYSNYGKPILDLSGKFTYDNDNRIIINFGKWQGCPASEHLDYLQWMLTKDFAQDTKNVICKIMDAEGF